MTNLSIVLPTYNEAKRVRAGIDFAMELARLWGKPTEILLVDDGSTDDTVVIAAAHHTELSILPGPHRGKGAAVCRGMLAAKGSIRLFSDIDWSVRPQEAQRMLMAMHSADVIIASRECIGSRRLGEPLWRHLLGRAFNRWIQSTFLSGHADTQCGCKAFTGTSASLLFGRVKERGWAFDVELLAQAHKCGLEVREFPVTWIYDPHSSINLFKTSSEMFSAVQNIKARMTNEISDSLD